MAGICRTAGRLVTGFVGPGLRVGFEASARLGFRPGLTLDVGLLWLTAVAGLGLEPRVTEGLELGVGTGFWDWRLTLGLELGLGFRFELVLGFRLALARKLELLPEKLGLDTEASLAFESGSFPAGAEQTGAAKSELG